MKYQGFVMSENPILNKIENHIRELYQKRSAVENIYHNILHTTEVVKVAGKIAEAENPDLIDINAGCWVKGVVGCGAGSGLLKDPPYMQELVKAVVDSTSLPVTVKTRLGWDENSIQILEVAKRMEDAGAVALTVHCRTRKVGHSGDADWSWIPKVKEVVKIPVFIIFSAMFLWALSVPGFVTKKEFLFLKGRCCELYNFYIKRKK